jgi:hypothetical protein
MFLAPGRDQELRTVEDGSPSAATGVDCDGVLALAAGDKVYCVGNTTHDTAVIAVIQHPEDTLVARVKSPAGIAATEYHPTRGQVYLIDQELHLVHVVDSRSDRVVRTIASPSRPRNMVLSTGFDRLVISGDSSVRVHDSQRAGTGSAAWSAAGR